MPLSITDTSYAGTVEAGFMITKATFGLESVKKGCVYVKDGIKKAHTIPNLDITNVLQTRAAIPTSNGTFAVDKVVITPQDAMGYVEFNPRDFESHFYAEELSPTLLARELPTTAENFMMQLFLNRCFESIESCIHMGSLGYTTNLLPAQANGQLKFFDGFIRKALVGNALQVATPVALTSANILAKMDAAIALLPKAIQTSMNKYKEVKFMLSVDDFQNFEIASLALPQKGRDINGITIMNYRGYEIVTLAGLPKDTFYLARAFAGIDSNMWIGTNSLEDLNIELMRLQNNAELFFVKSLFKFDTQIAKLSEFVIYTTKTTASFIA